MNSVILTVDVVLLTLKANTLHVAVLKRDNDPYQGVDALPGGYVHADEDGDARAAAVRVLRSKMGITSPYLEQLATFSGRARDPRGWSASIAYYALVAPEVIEATQHPEVKLVPVDRNLKLPFDHTDIVETAVARLRNKSQYSSLPCFLAGEKFTLPKLQRIYEALMAEPINKVSFRRKMDEMDMLEPINGERELEGAHRPAQVYRLKPKFRDELTLLRRGL